MRQNFERALAFTLSFEGGYVNHPKDPGGATNKGITLNTYRRHKPGASVADLKAIPQATVERIYLVDYWTPAKCDGLAPGVDGAVFDYAVNSGASAARKSLLAVVGGSDVETIRRLCARRLSIYQTFKHWRTFGKGWTRRVVTGEALWTKWALAAKSDNQMSLALRLTGLAMEAEAKADAQNANAGRIGATGGVGGTVFATTSPTFAPDWIDQLTAWALGGGTLTSALVMAAYFLWHAHVSRERADVFHSVARRQEDAA